MSKPRHTAKDSRGKFVKLDPEPIPAVLSDEPSVHGRPSGGGDPADAGTPPPSHKRRAMKMMRHRLTPPPAIPKRDRRWNPPEFIIRAPAQLTDEILQDLLQDLQKPQEEQSPYFLKLTQNSARLPDEDQKAKQALVLAVVALEGGNCSAAARKLRMPKHTVAKIVQRHRTRFPQTPDQIKAEHEHIKAIDARNRQGAMTVLDLMWNLTEISAQLAIDLVKAKAMPAAALAGIIRVASERALVLSGMPTSRTAKVAERVLSNDELEELRKQNEQIIREMRGDNPVDLKLVGE